MWRRSQLLAEAVGRLVAPEVLDLLSPFSTASRVQTPLASALTQYSSI